MRPLILVVYILSFFIVPQTLLAQPCSNGMSGTYSVGPGGNFSSITVVMDSLKSRGVVSSVLLELLPAYTSDVETFPIKFTKIPCADSSKSIVIRPAAGATNLKITSSDPTTTIDFNSGSFISIDGRSGGLGTQKNLEVSNTNVSGQAIRFMNAASNNSVRYTIVKGVTASAFSGVILIGGSDSAFGNKRIRIDTCSISSGSSLAANLIYGNGTPSKINDSITIDGCDLFDFYSFAESSNAIFFSSNTTRVTVVNNSIFQTATRDYKVSSSFSNVCGINMNTLSGGHLIANNFIGGSGPKLAGGRMRMTGEFNFLGISVTNGTGLANRCVIRGNTISNLYLENKFNTAEVVSIIRLGYQVPSFRQFSGDCTDNIIGSATADSAIIYKGVYRSDIAFSVIGIASNATSTSDSVNIQRNTISGLFIDPTTSQYNKLIGILMSPFNPFGKLRVLIEDNKIGNELSANSFKNNSAYQTIGIELRDGNYDANIIVRGNRLANLVQIRGFGTQGIGSLYGIFVSGSFGGFVSIEGNSVKRLYQGPLIFSSNTLNVAGIYCNATGTNIQNLSVSGNEIADLYSDNIIAGSASAVAGLWLEGHDNLKNKVNVSRNNIHYVFARSGFAGNAVASIYGIYLYLVDDSVEVANNIVALGINGTGNSLSTSCIYEGIREEQGAVMSYLHNTIYIGGKDGGFSAQSAAFASRAPANTKRLLINNIFVNLREDLSANTFRGYCYALFPSTTGLIDITSNFNAFYTSSTDGIIGNWGNLGDMKTLAQWEQTSGKDSASFFGNPNFANDTMTTGVYNLHIKSPTIIEGRGTSQYTRNADFDNENRNLLSPVDIGADAGNFLAIEPSRAALNINSSNITGNSAVVSTTPGDGTNRLFVIRKDNPVNAIPVDGNRYIPNNSYGLGAALGTGNFVVADTGSTITVAGLSPGTIYHVSVFEYNGRASSANYLTSTVPTTSFTTSGVTGLIDLQSEDFRAKLYPNPGQQFWLDVQSSKPSQTKLELSIIDLHGRVWQRKELNLRTGSNRFELSSISQLPKGVYLLQLKIGNIKGSTSLIKQ